MQVRTERAQIWMNMIGVFIFLVLSLFGSAMFGIFSGILIVAAHLNLRSSRRSGDKRRRLSAWTCVAIAWVGAGLGFCVWDWFLWDEHFHPGGGGAIPPPTHWDLATMPLISAGLGLGFLLMLVVLNAWLKWWNALSNRRLLSRSGT